MQKLYDVKEVSKMLKVHEVTIRRWISQKKINIVRIGTLIRIEQSEFDKLLERKK